MKKRRDTKLSEKEVSHVAQLANLKLTRQEISKFQAQLSKILDYVEVLKEMKTDKIEPTSQVTGLENVFREDKVDKSISQEKALSGAKSKYQGRFKIKAILEK